MKTNLTKSIILIIFIISCISSRCQEVNFPYSIEVGESVKIYDNKTKLWIITEKQFNQALKDAKILKNYTQQLNIVECKAIVMQHQLIEKDSLIRLLKKDRNFYKKEYPELIQENKKCILSKQFYKFSLIIGLPVVFVTGLLI